MMIYAVFGPDRLFRRTEDGNHLSLADDETAMGDPPGGIGPGWSLTDGRIVGPDDKLPIPDRVTNFQARAVMRQVPMPDGRSLFTTVDSALRKAVEATAALPEFDPARIEADLNWQAWEQANEYERNGVVTTMLASRYGFDDARTDDLFRQAEAVKA